MDFQSAMETFAEAWVAANTQTPLTEAAEAQSLTINSGGNSTAPPTGGGGTTTGGGSGGGGVPGSGPATPPLPPHGSPAEDQDRNSSSCEAPTTSRPSSSLAGKSLPVHCVLERVPSPQTENQQPCVEVDSYAIVPCAALFSDLVRTALSKLGYSPCEATCAKGVIQIKNWKPLAFEQITELPEATVGDILGDLQGATLRIRLYSRPKRNVVNDVKEKLLQVLLAQSHSLLVSSGCPIDQPTLAALSKGKTEWEISEETRKKFDQWYLHQVFQHCRQVALLQHQLQQQQQQLHSQQQQQQHQQHSPQQPRLLQISLSPVPVSHAPSAHQLVPVTTAITTPSSSSSRTRIRTSFDPELELPKLHRWFAENQHPSRLMIQQYVRELNALDSRRGRKPLDVNNVVYWFKNARAAHKRAELKFAAAASTVSAAPAAGNGILRGLPHGWDCMLDSTQDSEDGSGFRRVNGFAQGNNDASGMDEESCGESGSPEATLDLSVRGRERNGDSVSVKEEPPGPDSSSEMDGEETANESEEEECTGAGGGRQEGGDEDALDKDGGCGTLSDERRKRNRTFIDPVTEVPRLEQWFSTNTHPSHTQIIRHTEELNSLPYRRRFPRLEPRNIQFWFKNRRAKCKRLAGGTRGLGGSPKGAQGDNPPSLSE
uniref:Putative satb1 matrix attachment region binding protein n=1 Tax=Ornithodoros turicata TaxID=34597 RepID=A0A2R5LCP9_9ACAR